MRNRDYLGILCDSQGMGDRKIPFKQYPFEKFMNYLHDHILLTLHLWKIYPLLPKIVNLPLDMLLVMNFISKFQTDIGRVFRLEIFPFTS